METNRFKRTNYALPPQPTAPVADEFSKPRPFAPKMTPIRVTEPEVTKVEHLAPVYTQPARPTAAQPTIEQPVEDKTATINLNEPDTGGWLDSLAPKGAMEAQQAKSAALGTSSATQVLPSASTISVNINLPTEIKLPKVHLPALPAWPYKKIAIRSGIGMGVAVVLVVSSVVGLHFLKNPPQGLSASQRLAANLSQPTFTPAVPKGKAGEAVQQATNSSFDSKRDVYSYQDILNGTRLVVSQQPIPAKFNSASDAVTTIAKSMNAKTELKTHYGTAYLATDAKSQAQTIVVAVNSVLVFIQTPFKQGNSAWVSYINSLQQAAS